MLKKTLIGTGLISCVALGAVFLFYYHDNILDNTIVRSLHSELKMRTNFHVHSKEAKPYDTRTRIGDVHSTFLTREAVLKRESLIRTIRSNHKITYGKWHDPYTDSNYYSPTKLVIEHLVPMAEVERSGGQYWSREDRLRYINDLTNNPYTLIAVSAEIHKQKGNKDPAEWLPPNKNYRCTYIKHWMSVKETFHLDMDIKEAKAIITALLKCKQ